MDERREEERREGRKVRDSSWSKTQAQAQPDGKRTISRGWGTMAATGRGQSHTQKAHAGQWAGTQRFKTDNCHTVLLK